MDMAKASDSPTGATTGTAGSSAGGAAGGAENAAAPAADHATSEGAETAAQACAGLGDALQRHWHRFGRETPLEGLRLMVSDRPTGVMRALYRTSLCAVVQGAKVSLLGDRAYRYAAGHYLVASMDLPVSAQVVEASPDRPYIAFSLSIDPATVADLLLQAADEASDDPTSGTNSDGTGGDGLVANGLGTDDPAADEPVEPMAVGTLGVDLIDPLTRLIALLDTPRDRPVLAPLIRREIAWRVLTGPQGRVLRQIGLTDGRMARIARTLAWIRDHYAEPVRIPELAAMAHMSVASFHRHFKAATTMSPIRFQKQVRLQEARRLLLTEEREIAAVGFAIGYESASQFSRDYSRLFGRPPGRDGAALRAEARRTGAVDLIDA